MSDKRAEILAWLDEQEKLCAAATAGPWIVGADSMGGFNRIWATLDDGTYDIACCAGDGSLDSAPNEAFVAASRTVLPLALAALRGEVEAHVTIRGAVSSTCKPCRFPFDPGGACPTIERIHAATVGSNSPSTNEDR